MLGERVAMYLYVVYANCKVFCHTGVPSLGQALAYYPFSACYHLLSRKAALGIVDALI